MTAGQGAAGAVLTAIGDWLVGLTGAARYVAPARWVVVDTETSGLDAGRDQLLAIGAVAVVDGRIVLADSFEVLLRQRAPSSTANILVHGIGADAQRTGAPPGEALAAFRDYVGTAPLIAFHAPFDERILRRALRAEGLKLGTPAWLDLADLVGALFPMEAASRRSLDDWFAYFQIDSTERHNAAGDALATAELLLKLLPHAANQHLHGFADLLKAAKEQRWLRQHS